MEIYLMMILSYLLGAIPFSYILTKKLENKDVRNYGSGNVGATNAARILGIKMGIIIVLLDMLKGFLAVWLTVLVLAPSSGSYLPLLAGLLAIIGHNYSVFLKFSGGKGVAVTIGIMLYLAPLLILFALVIWIILVSITRYVSLGSISAVLSLPIFALIFAYNNVQIIFFLLYAILIVFSHRSNLKRLLTGEENKL